LKKLLSILSVGVLAGVVLAPPSARASTGTCDVDPGDTGPSELACLKSIAMLGTGTVVDDIFKDINGKTADLLLYGKLIDPYGGLAAPTAANGCPQANTICNGDLTSSQGSPAVICIDSTHDFNTVAGYVNNLDWKYANPIRMHQGHASQGAPFTNCPDWSNSVGDGNKEGYYPWEGMVFDLGGPSNKVVLFPVNDHGPQPCESVEYTVYLTNNPLSRTMIDNPTTTGADPQQWNRAKLSTIYLEGWKKVRPGADITIADPTNPANMLGYTIEADSFSSVWSLPCGINFRYVGIIAGNDGKDLPACNFDSFDAEIDAVAGLTETGAGVCPDADHDNYVDCNCNGAPPVCDCNDADPAIHPGAPEPCSFPDVNCDNQPGSCGGGLVCYGSICLPTCTMKENSFCPAGSICQNTPSGILCVPQDCSVAGCPAGTVCSNKICVPACTGVVCPGSQICQDGQCIDPCQGVQCPSPQTCQAGACQPPCNCFAGDIGCMMPAVCDANNTNICVQPLCKGVMCAAGQHCDATTGSCVGFCSANVVCPAGQKCVDPGGCVPLCTGITCPNGFDCNAITGTCEDTACQNVTCLPPTTCVMGVCVTQGTGGMGGAGSTGGMGGASSGTSSSDGGHGGAGGVGPGDVGKCGCRIPGDTTPATPVAGLLLAGLAGLGARRARRRR
jgi:MYXO-CTERM domain-containing protein